jgi:hypothetical protein
MGNPRRIGRAGVDPGLRAGLGGFAFALALGVGVGLTLGLINAPPAWAQLVDCPEIRDNAAAFKVILDEPAFARKELESDDELQRIKARLSFTVHNQLQALGMEMRQAAQPAVVLLPVSCRGRHPLDASDFDSNRSQSLTANKVVLEVWALLDGNRQGDKVEAREARIGYAVPPLRFYEPNAVELPGFYLLRYPRSGTDLTGILDGLPELSAYATLGLGLKAAKARDYDLAVQYLKKAEALLAPAAGPGSDAVAAQQQRALVGYVKKRTCETVKAALADAEYKGGLTLIYSGSRRPCP